MILGYIYPAYECFKTVEKNKPEMQQLRFWCQYWILIAVLSVFERVGDTFVSWIPLYSEAKLAFIVFLWCPKTKGSTFIYDSFFKPYVSKHETEIDRNLLELKTRARDMAFMYCRRAISCSQTRIFEILQYVAAQSTLMSRPTQEEQQTPKPGQAPATAATTPAKAPTSSTTASQQQEEIEDDRSSIQSSSTAASPFLASNSLKKSISMPKPPQSPKRLPTNKVEVTHDKTVLPKSGTTPEDAVEDAIRMTRGRLRKTQSTVNK